MTDLSLAPTRRDVLVGGAATAALLIGSGAVAQQPIRVRPDINSAAGQSMLQLYEKAVRAMQAPELNYPPQPTSWTFQAYVHGVPINPFDPANSGGVRPRSPDMQKRVDLIYGNPPPGSPQAAWKVAAYNCWATCTHFSAYFTTWHRWYVYYFERICREMCQDASFQLPYWNYGSDIGGSLQLPAPFRSSTRSRLYFDDRGLGFADPQGTGAQNVAMNNGGYMPYPQTDYGPALVASVMFPSDANYAAPPSPDYFAFGFTGRLECQPHDNVHDNVGGWMANVPSAAGDPIFYVHHCQIDRLYASWEAQPGVSYNWGSSSTQPSEQDWLGEPAAYVDEKGQLVKVRLGDAVNTAALGYAYDNLATPPAAAVATLSTPRAVATGAPLRLAAMRANNVTVGSGQASVTLTPSAPPPTTLAVPPASGRSAAHTLVLGGVKLLRRPPAPLSVFVNLPAGTVPRLNDPYYVGTLNLFNFDLGTGAPMAHGGTPAAHTGHDTAGGELRFDVGAVLREQLVKGLWDGKDVKVTVTTIGADNPGTAVYLTIGSIALLP